MEGKKKINLLYTLGYVFIKDYLESKGICPFTNLYLVVNIIRIHATGYIYVDFVNKLC